MRPSNIAFVCLLISACRPQDHVVPDPMPGDDGDGRLHLGAMRARRRLQEPVLGPARVRSGRRHLEECPPTADCVYQFWCTFSDPDPKPGSFACGPQKQCGAGQFCEVVASDIPEFETGYQRYECRQMPECDEANCQCVEHLGRCSIWDIEVVGTCTEPTPGAYTLTCGVGG